MSVADVTPKAGPVTVVYPSCPSLPLMSTHVGMNLDQILLLHGISKTMRHQIQYSQDTPKKIYLSAQEFYGFKKVTEQDFELLIFEDFLNQAKLLSVRGGVVSWKTTQVPYTYENKSAEGVINGSLLEVLIRQTKNEPLAQRFIEAFHTEIDMSRLERGARFSLKYSIKMFQGKAIRFGEITEAQLENAGQVFKRRFVGDLSRGTFVGPDSREESFPLYAPVNFIKVTSLFSKRRFHPVRRNYQAHLGMDYELPEGWPVLAAASGRVIKMESHRASGNYIVIEHAGRLSTGYLHLQSMNASLRVGTKVRVGQEIGKVGCTGYCTKAHLHYFVKKGEEAVDPSRYTRSYPLSMTTEVIEARKRIHLENQFFTQTDIK